MNLKKRWSVFLSTVLDPFLLILLFVSIGLVCYTSTQQESNIVGLLTVLLSISSAILGTRLMNLWHDYTEGKIIVKRGIMAIRNLILLLKNINLLEKRVDIYIQRIPTHKNIKDFSITYFEEIVEKFHIIEEETVNSIEDWKDIIPEADVKTQIGIITDLKKELSIKHKEKEVLTNQLEHIKNQTNTEKEDLKKEIKIKEQQISKLKDELLEKTHKISSSPILSGITSGSTVADYLIQYPSIPKIKISGKDFYTALDQIGKVDDELVVGDINSSEHEDD
ncbi:MAG: hypothetical protein ACTSYF_03670 [Promethearchaeota archaeon]